MHNFTGIRKEMGRDWFEESKKMKNGRNGNR